MASTDLYDLALELLAAADASLADAPGGQIPEPFVSPGLPAFDFTPMLTVHVGSPQTADTFPLQPPLQPGHRVEIGAEVPLISLTITCTRLVPIVEVTGGAILLPNTLDMDAAAQLIDGDLWAIWNGLRARYKAGALFASDSGKREFFFEGAVAFNPQGGHGGWEMPVRVHLGGYAPTI